MKTYTQCWRIFQCSDQACPVYGKDEPCCWLVPGVYPRTDVHGEYLEPMEACLGCRVFESNAPDTRVRETFGLIKKQFGTYRRKVQKRSEIRNIRLTSINEKLQRQVADKEAAEKACLTVNEELNNFIRTVSHDLKTPIISIKGFSARLLKTKGNHLGKQGKAALKQIMTSADRMESLVLDLLHLSQVGETDSHFRKLSVRDIITEVISSLEDTIRNNAIRVTMSDDLPEIYCDEGRIFQVFENLIVNAVRFTKDAESPTIEIGYKEREEAHEFYVRDNGIGIDPKDHQRIFNMFCQLAEIKDSKSTGLGLTIVQKIINRYGGRVWVDSEKGKGATFYFTLPKKSP